MPINYKRVPSIDKCFSILELMTETRRPLGFTEIVRKLDLNKSTVFNILHTLNDLGVLDKRPDGLFNLGPKLFTLGNAAAVGSELIQTVHPYLEKINREYMVSTFLGILSGKDVVIIDKADNAQKIKISSEIGMKIPVFAGVAGKALLSQLPDSVLDEIIKNHRVRKYTRYTITDADRLKKEILKVRETGIAYDMEEYIEGLIAAAVPVVTNREDLQAAIWTVGLKQEVKKKALNRISNLLLKTAGEINCRFSTIK